MLIHFSQSFIFCICLALTQAGSAQAADKWDVYESILQSLPNDASIVIDNAVQCNHFSGEINGDNSLQDKQTYLTMDKLGCNEVEKKILDMKKKYRNNASVLEAIKIYYLN